MEEWQDIPEFDGVFQVSNQGQFRSLTREVTSGLGLKRIEIGRALKTSLTKNGYVKVQLRLRGKSYTLLAHRVVARVFLGYSTLTIDHKNKIKTDNKVTNLEYVSGRVNSERHFLSLGRELQIGVFYVPRRSKRQYSAQIKYNKKKHHLGYFDTPEEASEVYQRVRRELS